MIGGATIVYESTVYPGATEEVCIPELEKASGMRWKDDFFVGYSPERINPGDRDHSRAFVHITLRVDAGASSLASKLRADPGIEQPRMSIRSSG